MLRIRDIFAYSLLAVMSIGGGWAAATIATSTQTGSTQDDSGWVARQSGQAAFSMTGQVSRLTPGVQQMLSVQLSNPNAWNIRLLTLTVTAGAASPRCTAANLRLGAYDSQQPGAKPVIVPANGTAQVAIPVLLIDRSVNQDFCKGVQFPLQFHGTAQRVRAS